MSDIDLSDDAITCTINPYALARVVVGDVRGTGPEDGERLLQSAFGMTLAEMISRPGEAPIWAAVHDRPGDPSRLHASVLLSGVELRARPDAPGWLRRLSSDALQRVVSVLAPTLTQQSDASAPVPPPDGSSYKDAGTLLIDGLSALDVAQGAVGDCYFMASLTSVAFTQPERLTMSKVWTTHTGSGFTATFNHGWRVQFYGYPYPVPIPVTSDETVPVHEQYGTPVYGHSTTKTEVWPAVYEKAFAMYRTGNFSQQPNYEKISGGSAGRAIFELTGVACKTVTTTFMGAESAILGTVKSNSDSAGRARTPMAAATYSETSVDEAGGPDFACTGIVGRHAYSVLGWCSHKGMDYLVLRNPWGDGVPTLSTALCEPSLKWAGFPLGVKGLFAIPPSSFIQYWRRFWWQPR